MSTVLADDTRGDFSHDTDNDASIFTSWFDAPALIGPNLDVLIYAVVNDIDNTSTELTVTLYYSEDSFAIHNATYIMSFADSPEFYYFNYTILFPGEPAGTYYQYYFQVWDGATYIRKPSETGVYFDVQWDAAPSDDGNGNEPAPKPEPEKTEEEPLTEEIINIIIDDDGTLVLILITLLLSLTILLLINRRHQESKKQR